MALGGVFSPRMQADQASSEDLADFANSLGWSHQVGVESVRQFQCDPEEFLALLITYRIQSRTVGPLRDEGEPLHLPLKEPTTP